MSPSRVGRGCSVCGQPVPERPNARYCSRACQQKAYRARHARDDAVDLARLRAQLDAHTAALAQRDAVIQALRAELDGLRGPAGPQPSRDDRTPPGPPPPTPPAHTVQPDVTPQGEDRWVVTLAGTPAGTITRRTRPTGGTDWSAHTTGGREAWAGGPPRSLEDAARMLAGDLRSYLTAHHEHHHAKIRIGRPRKNGTRQINRGTAPLGEARPTPDGAWHAWVPASTTGTGGLLRDQDGRVIPWPNPTAAAQAIADHRLAAAEAHWHGHTPDHKHPTTPQAGQPTT